MTNILFVRLSIYQLKNRQTFINLTQINSPVDEIYDCFFSLLFIIKFWVYIFFLLFVTINFKKLFNFLQTKDNLRLKVSFFFCLYKDIKSVLCCLMLFNIKLYCYSYSLSRSHHSHSQFLNWIVNDKKVSFVFVLNNKTESSISNCLFVCFSFVLL